MRIIIYILVSVIAIWSLVLAFLLIIRLILDPPVSLVPSRCCCCYYCLIGYITVQ